MKGSDTLVSTFTLGRPTNNKTLTIANPDLILAGSFNGYSSCDWKFAGRSDDSADGCGERCDVDVKPRLALSRNITFLMLIAAHRKI